MDHYNTIYISLLTLLLKLQLIKMKRGQVAHALTMVFGHGPSMPPCSIPLPMVDTSLHYITILLPHEDT